MGGLSTGRRGEDNREDGPRSPPTKTQGFDLKWSTSLPGKIPGYQRENKRLPGDPFEGAFSLRAASLGSRVTLVRMDCAPVLRDLPKKAEQLARCLPLSCSMHFLQQLLAGVLLKSAGGTLNQCEAPPPAAATPTPHPPGLWFPPHMATEKQEKGSSGANGLDPNLTRY